MIRILLLLLATVQTAAATAIIVSVQNGVVWVGADSLRNNSDDSGFAYVDKAHKEFGGLFLMYGTLEHIDPEGKLTSLIGPLTRGIELANPLMTSVNTLEALWHLFRRR